jgi:hypothetical protein
MGRSHEIDVVATPFRKVNHRGGSVRRLRILSLVSMTDVIILTETAEQVAGTQKDST